MAAITEDVVANLNPPELWKHFWELTQIPRPSGHEARVSRYVKDIADSKGLDWAEDSTGNLVVRLKGAGEFAGSPPLLIQGHLDMVCEKTSDVQVNGLTSTFLHSLRVLEHLLRAHCSCSTISLKILWNWKWMESGWKHREPLWVRTMGLELQQVPHVEHMFPWGPGVVLINRIELRDHGLTK